MCIKNAQNLLRIFNINKMIVIVNLALKQCANEAFWGYMQSHGIVTKSRLMSKDQDSNKMIECMCNE